jgi:hypothetical protein
VADALPPADPTDSRVAFFNRATNREINLVSFMPQPPAFKKYHIHPHPQFCFNDQYVCYTTTVLGSVDVAFAPVSQLTRLTSP